MFMLTWPKYLDILLFLICFSGATFLSSQTNAIKYQSSNQSALGSNMSSLKGVFGTLGNPGNIAQSNTSFSFLATSEQRFFLGSLNSTSIASIKKIGAYDYLGVSFGSFGIDAYKERRFSVSYSRMVAQNISIGSTAHYYLKSIQEYRSENDFDINIGLNSELSDNLELGIVVYNILSNQNKGYLREHTEMATGISYLISQKVNWLLEFRTNFSDHTSFSTGISYQIIDHINLQIGTNSLDNGISVGISYKLNDQWSMNASSRSNQNLGVSPGLSLLYEK